MNIWNSLGIALVLSGLLTACAGGFPAADEPASSIRMARFIGLVSRCGCSDLTREQVLQDYGKILGDRYTPEEKKAMRGYIDSALAENYSNQLEICLEVCAHKCGVNTVAEALGGKTYAGVAACPVTERGLFLTVGRNRM